MWGFAVWGQTSGILIWGGGLGQIWGDIYNVLAKAEHGVCKINQLPWEYDERINKLKKELEEIAKGTYLGFYSKHRQNLLEGLLHDNFPIVTELRRVTRRATLDCSKTTDQLVEEGVLVAAQFAQRINHNHKSRIEKDGVSQLTAGAFRDWYVSSFRLLVDVANSSGRNYANLEKLGAQYDMLKCRFEETRLALMSSTIADFMKKRSRIQFD